MHITVQHEPNRAEVLRRSILKKVLSSRLVPQNLDDEPALVLLEHILAEKAVVSSGAHRRADRR